MCIFQWVFRRSENAIEPVRCVLFDAVISSPGLLVYMNKNKLPNVLLNAKLENLPKNPVNFLFIFSVSTRNILTQRK